MILITLGFAWAFASPSADWRLWLHPGTTSNFRSSIFAIDTADNYGGNWYALRLPLANGLAYRDLPPMFTIEIGATIDSTLEIRGKFPLRRDIEAWHLDKAGKTFTGSPSELNINVPEESWAVWRHRSGFVMGGRFPINVGPSPNSIVLGSGVPYHDAIRWQEHFGHARYDFILSSLNAHLTSAEDWQQQNFSVTNARGRIYSEPQKNLLLHRVQAGGNWGHVALIEQSLIGGKSLSFREVNPFMAWHDNYGDGFTKASTTFEVLTRPLPNTQFYWQLDAEDIASPVGEGGGATAPTTLGALAGWSQEWHKDSVWRLWSRLDAVYTDPAFNNHNIPLLKMTSRFLYRSNFRKQQEPFFADTYILDYPLGYQRGPDALDLWWNMGWEYKPRRIGGEFELAWLRQGNNELWTAWNSASQHPRALSGLVEEDRRASFKFWAIPFPRIPSRSWDLKCLAGAGLRYLENEEHVSGKNRWDLGWNLGVEGSVGSR